MVEVENIRLRRGTGRRDASVFSCTRGKGTVDTGGEAAFGISKWNVFLRLEAGARMRVLASTFDSQKERGRYVEEPTPFSNLIRSISIDSSWTPRYLSTNIIGTSRIPSLAEALEAAVCSRKQIKTCDIYMAAAVLRTVGAFTHRRVTEKVSVTSQRRNRPYIATRAQHVGRIIDFHFEPSPTVTPTQTTPRARGAARASRVCRSGSSARPRRTRHPLAP